MALVTRGQSMCTTEEKSEDATNLVRLEPTSLHFRISAETLGERMKTGFLLRNISEKRVAFRVKTTAPDRYVVRPNAGFLDPKTSKRVRVVLLPMSSFDCTNPPKHRFLIIAKHISEDVTDRHQIWKEPMEIKDLQCLTISTKFDEETSLSESSAALNTTTVERSEGGQELPIGSEELMKEMRKLRKKLEEEEAMKREHRHCHPDDFHEDAMGTARRLQHISLCLLGVLMILYLIFTAVAICSMF